MQSKDLRPPAGGCQAEKQLERKDAHRKSLLPNLRLAEVSDSTYPLGGLIFNKLIVSDA